MTTHTADAPEAAAVPEREPDAGARARLLHDRLKAQLAPELWRLVYQYGEAKERAREDREYDEVYLMVEMIAAHFPGLAPAIRCMVQHGWDSDYGRGAECGVVPWPPTGAGRSGADE